MIYRFNAFNELDNANKTDMDTLLREFYLRSVRPELRGLGVGTDIMRVQLEYMKKLKSHKNKLKSCIYESNSASLALAEKYGFEVVRAIPTPLVEDCSGVRYKTLLIMELNL